MSVNVSNVEIKPINVRWEIEERVCVDVSGVVAATLQDKYFRIYDRTTTYNVVFDLDNAGVTSPGGGTDIEVDVATGDSEATVIAAIETAIEAATGYEGAVNGSQMILTLDTTDVVATDAADVDTGFIFDVLNKGGSTDLGLIDGDVEPSFTEDKLDVTAHQFGTSILAQLRQGNNAEVTIALKESSNALYKEIFTAGGETFTPASGTEVFGWGDSKQGTNVIRNARRLVFHPVANAEADKSEDLTFWYAYPNPDSIVYSGENFNLLNVTFTTFLDLTKARAVRRFVYGDSSQTGFEA